MCCGAGAGRAAAHAPIFVRAGGRIWQVFGVCVRRVVCKSVMRHAGWTDCGPPAPLVVRSAHGAPDGWSDMRSRACTRGSVAILGGMPRARYCADACMRWRVCPLTRASVCDVLRAVVERGDSRTARGDVDGAMASGSCCGDSCAGRAKAKGLLLARLSPDIKRDALRQRGRLSRRRGQRRLKGDSTALLCVSCATMEKGDVWLWRRLRSLVSGCGVTFRYRQKMADMKQRLLGMGISA